MQRVKPSPHESIYATSPCWRTSVPFDKWASLDLIYNPNLANFSTNRVYPLYYHRPLSRPSDSAHLYLCLIYYSILHLLLLSLQQAFLLLHIVLFAEWTTAD